MRARKPILIAGAVALIATGCAHVSTVEEHIRRHARQSDAEEHPPARRYASGDIDGDGIPDTAVIYTLESFREGSSVQKLLRPNTVGRNNFHAHFLAVSLSSSRTVCFTQVGGKGIRSVDGIAIRNRRIALALLDFGPTDALCCPSVPANTTYILDDGGLFERKPEPKTCIELWAQ